MSSSRENLSKKYISNISANLKTLLDLYSMNILELSNKTEISHSAVYSLVQGTSNPTLDTLTAVAAIFNINISQLVGEFSLFEDKVKYVKSTPIIDWTNIVDFFKDASSVKRIGYTMVSTDFKIGDDTFALYSNTKTEPLFKLGALLIFNKPTVPITSYDDKFVLLLDGKQSPAVKKLCVEGSKIFLQSINPTIPSVELNDVDQIIAYLLQVRIDF